MATAPGQIIRLFISSTFSDFTAERTLLQQDIFPTLRDLCRREGFRFQPIDLRWGVSQEAGEVGRTLSICFDELCRCQEISPDFNLLILLGDRYGWRPLPESIPAEHHARLAPLLTLPMRALLEQVYAEDRNARPPEYVLLPRHHDRASWETEVAEPLHEALAQACGRAGFTLEEAVPYIASATHQEIWRGLLAPGCDPSAALCAMRTFGVPPTGVGAETYFEAAPEVRAQVAALKGAIRDRLGDDDRMLAYTAGWKGNEPELDLQALGEHLYKLLERRVREVIARRRQTAPPDAVAAVNDRFSAERTEHFVGRAQPLADIATYLNQPATVPLVVTGPGGAGKSTLLARAVEQARSAHPSALLLARYIGITPGDDDFRILLDGLRADLATAYGHAHAAVDEDYDQAPAFAEALGWTTADRPLIMVLDALDQLGPPPVPLDWLPHTLPPHVHLIVSLLDEDDRPEPAMLAARRPAPVLMPLDRLDAAEGDALLDDWLAASHRTLQAAQRTAVLAAFVHEGRPLYLRLVFEEARRWRSFDQADVVSGLPPLDPTIPGILAARFARLERPDEHGLVLTGHMLGLLHAAENGLAEDELLALLARDAAVADEQQTLAPHSPPIEPNLPLPAALWARLYADLAPYLTEREADGGRLLTFYHRELAEVVERRYLQSSSESMARHTALARYFESQPLMEGTQPNRRKLSEQAIQEAKSALADDLRHTLTDLSFLQEQIDYLGARNTLEDLAQAPADDTTLKQIRAAIQLGARELDEFPEQVETQLRARLPVTASAALHDAPPHVGPWLRLDSRTLAPVGGPLRRILGYSQLINGAGFSPDGRLVLSASWDKTLRLQDVESGQTLDQMDLPRGSVEACAFSPDGRLVLSASADATLRLWEVGSGEVGSGEVGSGEVGSGEVGSGRTVHVLAGHSGPVAACAFSPDGRLVLSASDDKTLRLWDVASGQTVHVLVGHTDAVRKCAFSPDGRLVLSASWDKTLRLWDVASGQTVHVLVGHTDGVEACAFSPDGRLVLSASDDKTLRLWEVERGQTVHILQGHADGVWACAFSPDGRLVVSSSADATVRLWEVASGQTMHVLTGHSGVVNACAFSPDGRLVLSASGADSTLRLWDVERGQTVHELVGHSYAVWACAFSPDGRLVLSASDDKTLRLWDVASGQTVHELTGHADTVWACAFSPDGHLVLSASGDQTLQLWEVASGQTVQFFFEHSHGVMSCSFSPDGRLVVSSSADATVRLWEVGSGQAVQVLVGHTNLVRSCSFGPDGRLVLSASRDKTLRLWDVASGQTVHTLEGHSGPVTACAVSPDGHLLLSASADKTLRLWDVASGQTVHILQGHADTVWACAFSPDGRLVLSASWDKTLRLWDVASGQTVHILQGHADGVGECAFSPDGRLVLSAWWNSHTLCLWEVASGQAVHELVGHTDGVNACAFSPDGHLILSASADKTLRLWEVGSGQTVQVLQGHTNRVTDCAFSPDGRLALSSDFGNGETLRLWEVTNGQTVQVPQGHSDEVWHCAFSPDGRLALSASRDKTLRLWQVADGQTVHVLVGHTDAVRKCAFSPDGRLVLSASADQTLRLWEVGSGQTAHTLEGHTNGVNACAFSPDGRLILSASDDQTLRLWEVGSGQTVQVLQGHSGSVQACAFSPDGHLILSASADQTLRLWDVGSGQMVHVLQGHTDGVSDCSFSPDGCLILSASWHDHTLRLWEVASGQMVHVLQGHTDGVNDAVFSPDGRLVLSSAYWQDKTLRLWDVGSGQMVHVLQGHSGSVQACAFSPDGRLVLSASSDNTLRLWDAERGHEWARFAAAAGLWCCAFNPQGDHVVAGDAGGAVHLLTVMDVTARTVPTAPTPPLDMAGLVPHDLASAPLPSRLQPRPGGRWWWPFHRRGGS